jgi:hypothetical protein
MGELAIASRISRRRRVRIGIGAGRCGVMKEKSISGRVSADDRLGHTVCLRQDCGC